MGIPGSRGEVRAPDDLLSKVSSFYPSVFPDVDELC